MPIHLLRLPEKSWPAAWVDLIDALRAYIEADEAAESDLRQELRDESDSAEVARVEAMLRAGEADRERYRALLRDMEKHGIDPTLGGVLR